MAAFYRCEVLTEERNCNHTNAMASHRSEIEEFLRGHGLSVSLSDAKGRCLVASRLFRRGAEILNQEPYVAVLEAGAHNKRCDRCYTESSNLKRCSACKSVFYCCADCQRKEWAVHKHECEVLVRLLREKQRRPTSTLRMVLRLLIKRQLQADEVLPRTAIENYEVCEALPAHMGETGEERLVMYAQMAQLVQQMIAPDKVEVKEITQIICRFACNAHTICDEEVRPVGTGLYPVISIINHSCLPNAVLHFDGKRASVYAVEDIKEGAEITISYVELAASTETRCKALRDQYYFDCGCGRCRCRGEVCEGRMKCVVPDGAAAQMEIYFSAHGSLAGSREDAFLEGYRCVKPDCKGPLLRKPGNEKTLTCEACGSKHDEREFKTLATEVEKMTLEASRLYSDRNVDEAWRLYKEVESAQRKLYHPYSVYLMRTCDNLLKVAMDLANWTAALEYCRRSIPAYTRSYPSYSPLLGLQLYMLGKLEWLMENTTEAIDALEKACEILQVTHGSGSTLVQSIRSTLQEAQAEAAQKRLM